ncbi:ferrous iron transport protein A [Oribacterium sp. oral taxon 102]|uniref:FeoA family protein n=1 Tax=Oribacterium sp. oral taxon 102 TaxID=671214 RepID=UPI0015B8A31E|nr:FeoA domain-containing protein [Oribacterium sp. oral taxon 102]NWO21005.1 ferrous iron transport protein A [Oribacterium sp. oral taxon 102]
MPLTLADTGIEQTIQRIGGSSEVRQHLSDMGFVPGGSVTVISTSAGNLIVKVKEARVAISKEMAAKIIV